MRKVIASVGVAGVLLISLSGCSIDKITEPFKDAPRGKSFEGPADIVTMPDGFSNISTKCGPGGNRFTVVYHGDGAYGAISVVQDPTCPK